MNIQNKIIENKKVIFIYVNEDELKNEKIRETIENLKEKNMISIFVSGEITVEKTLNNLVKIMKNQ